MTPTTMSARACLVVVSSSTLPRAAVFKAEEKSLSVNRSVRCTGGTCFFRGVAAERSLSVTLVLLPSLRASVTTVRVHDWWPYCRSRQHGP